MTVEKPEETPAGGTPPANPPTRFAGSATGAPLAAPAADPPAPKPDDQQPPRPAVPSRPRVSVDDLPEDALLKRLDTAKRQGGEEAVNALLKELGLESVDALKATAAEAKKLRDAEDARKRAQMTETDRLKSDLTKRDEELARARAKIAELEEGHAASETEVVVSRIAAKYVDPEMYLYAAHEFRQHVRELERQKIDLDETVDEAYVDKFFRGLVKRKPKLAAAPAAPASKPEDPPKPPAGAAPPKPAPKPAPRPVPAPARRPLSFGGPPRGAAPPAPPAPPGTSINGKDVRPGRANSMNKAELREHLKGKGMKSW